MKRTKTDMIEKDQLEEEERRIRQQSVSLRSSIKDLEGIADTRVREQVIEYLKEE